MLERLKSEQFKPSTGDNYYGIWKNFNKFVIKLDVIPDSWEKKLNLYCAHLVFDKKLQSSTVRSYVTAIKQVLSIDGYRWNHKQFLLATFTRHCRLKNDRLFNRLPFTRGVVELMLYETRHKFSNQPYLEVLYLALFSTMYYGLFRISEIANGEHAVKAVNVHEAADKKSFKFTLLSSKTHTRAKRPQEIKIKKQSHTRFCPVSMIRDYVKLRPRYKSEHEIFFVFSEGTPVEAHHVRTLLKTIMARLGMNEKNYGTHSFRIGRATDLEHDGLSISRIKKLGRWRSNAVYNYLR